MITSRGKPSSDRPGATHTSGPCTPGTAPRTSPASSEDFSPQWDLESALERVSRRVLVGPEVFGGVAETPSKVMVDSDGRSRRRRILSGTIWFVLILISSLSAYVVSAMRPPVYGARMDIVYGLQLADSFVEERRIATQMALIKSRAVLGAAARDVNGSVEELEGALEVELVPRSAFLQVTVADPDPDRARALVRAVVSQYTVILEGENGRDEDAWLNELADAQEAIRQRLEELERQRQQWGLAGQPPPTADEETRLMAEEADLRVRLAELRARADESQAQRAQFEGVRVLTEPYLLPRPLSPTPGQTVTAGALAGIAVATLAVAALWAARMRDTTEGEAR